jgi:hypothetical protein
MNIRLEILPDDFNEEIYFKLNPDVYSVYLLNHEFNSTFHYQHIGYLENRQYKVTLPEDFNEEIYYKLYPDVYNVFLLNPEMTATFHYISQGYFEKRPYKVILPEDFNEEVYYKLHSDVYNAFLLNPETTATFHYINQGYFEKRPYKVILPEDFNEEIYYKLYPDVYNAFLLNPEIAASFHYINMGYFEKRPYKVILPEDFNEEIYYKLNPDVKEVYLSIPSFTAIFHYINLGYFENRQYKVTIPEDFNEEIYYRLHPDVKEVYLSNPKLTASVHYSSKGFLESIQYKVVIPDDFVEEIYFKLNSDVYSAHLSNPEITATSHYLNQGFFENRKYKIELDPNLFNKDLYNCYNKNYDINKSLLKKKKKNFNNKISYQNEKNNIISRIDYQNEKFIKLYNYDIDFVNIRIKDIDFQKPYLLVIDFPNLGGGTSVFLKTIIKKYKEKINFLIARNLNDYIKFTINDDYLIDKTFNEKESIDFVNSIKNSIKKIFINHLLGHSINFLNNIFSFQLEISLITHDYFCITKNTQPLYEEIVMNNKSYFDMKIFNRIITQNKANIHNIEDKLYENQEIVIAPLPDFKYSGNYFQTNNENIVVAIIGAISDIKGRDIIDNLYDYIYINKLNIDVVIFGEIYIKHKNFYKYENINELNDLLVRFKPNVILETSIWPETYSYTLTLSMLTQLPIISLKKPYNSVVENRLFKYKKNKEVYYFSSLNELVDLIPKVKQNYFYTIEPYIYFNSFWENYFNDLSSSSDFKFINIENKNIVLITSKIFVSDLPYSYISKRSVYSSEERFNQTIETINSIKKYIPNTFIVLFDNSTFDINNHFFIVLKQNVDLFINIYDNEELNYYTDIYPYRLFAEISQQIEFYNVFLKNINLSLIKNFFKISGRYTINKNFNYLKYNNNKNIFKKNNEISDRDYYYTSFYKLDKDILKEYFEKLIIINKNKEKYSSVGYDFEVVVPNTIIDNITLIDTLGITQRISVYGGINEI